MSKHSSDLQHQRTIASGTILKLELSEYYAARSWRPAIRSLVKRLQDGDQLESIIEAPEWKTPLQFKALLVEALRVADPGQLVLDVCRQREATLREWRGLLSSLVYPGVLLMAALVLSLFFGFLFTSPSDVMGFAVFGLRGYDYALAMRNDQLNALLGLSIGIVWTMVTLTAVLLIGPRWSVYAIIGGLPLIGGPLRWLGLSELLGRTELFTRQGMTFLDAIRAAGRTFHGSGLATIAQAAGRRVAQGTPHGQALKQSMLSDGLCRPALGLLDTESVDPHQRLRQVSELLQSMAAKRCRTLVFVLPSILFLAVGSIIGNAINSYFAFFMMTVSMISSLA